MIDETVSFIVILAMGVGGGFLSSWMSFNASGETFSGRKHGNALITGALTGLALAIASAVVDVSTMTFVQFGVLAVTVFLSAAGIDRLRTSGSDMVARDSPTPSK